jgi:hypothetical protein
MNKHNDKNLVISYLTLRRAIGILGISFPVILVLGSIFIGGYKEIQKSISFYYYTNMGDVFVGFLCAVGLFLFSYTGHDWRDKLAGDLGCVFALGVAFWPPAPAVPPPGDLPWVHTLHLISACLLFGVLIYFSLALFPRTNKQNLTARKKKRNIVFKLCGYLMAVCLLLLILYFAWLKKSFPGLACLKPVFWLESIALVSFGVSWITKGQLLWKDTD